MHRYVRGGLGKAMGGRAGFILESKTFPQTRCYTLDFAQLSSTSLAQEPAIGWREWHAIIQWDISSYGLAVITAWYHQLMVLISAHHGEACLPGVGGCIRSYLLYS